ncbi:MAG: peptide-methionine (S)-S-oxide reductase MsrA [Crocinitomicaceae bacterium]|nr:peptide-methionine (S)-S-oxide reductase MsrA [Crocinitomicaceae bacterium]
MKRYTFLFTLSIAAGFFSFSCQTSSATGASNSNEIKHDFDTTGLEKAHFASGCFWCVEAIYESVQGVKEVYNGYSGGHTRFPTYEDSNTGATGHAEAVQVWYDPNEVSFKELVEVYFGSQDVEQVNGQGPDWGSQYRSIAFYNNADEKIIIEEKIAELEAKGLKVASEVMAFEIFWMGEDYHQNYERLHPNHSYIKAVSIPRLNQFKRKHPHLLKKDGH